jgi:hypothetical protein
VVPLIDAAAPGASPAPTSPAAPSTGNTFDGGNASSAPLVYLGGALLVIAGAGGLALAARRVS